MTEDLEYAGRCEYRVGGEQEMPGADLVHDDIVDGVFIVVLVVAQPHREALCIIALKVLHQRRENSLQKAMQTQIRGLLSFAIYKMEYRQIVHIHA